MDKNQTAKVNFMRCFKNIAYVFFPFFFKWREILVCRKDLDSSCFKHGVYKIGKCRYEVRREKKILFFKRVGTPLLMSCKENIEFCLVIDKVEYDTILNIEFKADLYTRIFSMIYFTFAFIMNLVLFITNSTSAKDWIFILFPCLLLVPSVSFYYRHRLKITSDVISDLKTLCK